MCSCTHGRYFNPTIDSAAQVTVVEAAWQLLQQDSSARVLLCAPCNAAADVLCSRLADFGMSPYVSAHSNTSQVVPSRKRVTVNPNDAMQNAKLSHSIILTLAQTRTYCRVQPLMHHTPNFLPRAHEHTHTFIALSLSLSLSLFLSLALSSLLLSVFLFLCLSLVLALLSKSP